MVASVPLGTKAIAELNNTVPAGATSRVAIKFAEQAQTSQRHKGGQYGSRLPAPHFPPYGAPGPYGAPPGPYGAPMGRHAPYGGGYGPVRHDRSHARSTPMGAPRSPVGARATGEEPYAPGENPAYSGYCLFTYNLPTEYDETMMSNLYAPYGAASDVKLMRDPETGVSRVRLL